MSPVRLILASRSPRRAQLLRDAGYVFEQIDPPFQDDACPPPAADDDPEAAVMALASRKAVSLGESAASDLLILSADTVVIDERGSAIGAPRTADEAQTILRRLIGCRHRVVTGVVILHCRPGRERESVCFADTAWVDVGRVSDRDLADYLASGKWRGKAGGYNLFERQDSGWAISVDGDPTTVVGLPMAMLAGYLDNRLQAPETAGT